MERENESLSNGPGHMTKMAVMLIYGKNLNILSGTKKPMILKLGMQHRVLEYYQVYSNGDPVLPILQQDQIWSLLFKCLGCRLKPAR